MNLQEAIDKANTYDTLAGLQEALGMSDDQIACRLGSGERQMLDRELWAAEKVCGRNRKDWLRALRWLLVEKWAKEELMAREAAGLSWRAGGKDLFCSTTA